jgi:hypothetical protein
MPYYAHAALGCGLEKSLSEQYGRSMGAAWARLCMFESNVAALYKLNGKDTI